MKAIDYFNKYKLTIIDNDKLSELFDEMNQELKEIVKKRGSNRDAVVVPIIKGMNQKWNKLCYIYEKEYGREVLVRNGYIDFWKKHIPQLRV